MRLVFVLASTLLPSPPPARGRREQNVRALAKKMCITAWAKPCIVNQLAHECLTIKSAVNEGQKCSSQMKPSPKNREVKSPFFIHSTGTLFKRQWVPFYSGIDTGKCARFL